MQKPPISNFLYSPYINANDSKQAVYLIGTILLTHSNFLNHLVNISVRTLSKSGSRMQVSHPNRVAIYALCTIVCFDSTSALVILHMRLVITFHYSMPRAKRMRANPAHRRNIPIHIHELLIIHNSAMLRALAARFVVRFRRARERCDGFCQQHERSEACDHCPLQFPHLSYFHS